ncbi:unnamed protein product [Closterium sp. NIES-54]
MATPRVLRFDAEGRPLEFSVWLLRACRLLESQVQADESVWAHASGDLPKPYDPAPLSADLSSADRDSYACQRADLKTWKSRDATACIALSSLLPESEEAHFTQVRTASEFLTAIKARYATPTTVSLGRLFLPILFPDLALFERSADLITHLCSLDSSYRAACTIAHLALLPPHMAITIYFIATSLPGRIASVPSTSGAAPPPLFHGSTVPHLPTFTASLATAATDVIADAVTTSSRSRGRSGRRGGQGAGKGGGGGGGGMASGGGRSTEVGRATRAVASDSPSAAGGGDTRVRQAPASSPTAGTPHAMYAVVDSSASDSVYLSVVSLGASVAEVAVSGQVPVSGPVAASFSCRSLAHPTILWHNRMGHPSISRLRAMYSQCLVLGLPRVLPSLPPSLAPPCGPCVEGRLRATPHSSICPATEPFETLHLDVWSPAPRPGPERESFFLVVVDDYSRYTTVFPLAKKSQVTSTLIRWSFTTADTCGRRVNCLHSDRGGLVMEIARTSMIHARAPHFLWPYAVRCTAHHLNLWPRVSRPEASPTSLWTGSPGVASRFRILGSLALVRDTSPCALPCVFLGFPKDSSDFTFYHPPFTGSLTPATFVLSTPQVLSPSPQSSSQPTADPAEAGARVEDLGGATSGGVGVGAETVLARGPGARAVPRGARTGGAGAPSTGPGESGTGRIAAGGAGSGGGATGALESGPGATTALETTPPPHPYPTSHQARLRLAREEQLELEREGQVLERQQLELQHQAQQPHLQEHPTFPPPDPTPAVFPRSQPPLSPPLSHAWTSRSPRAHPSSPVPLTDLRIVFFRPSMPRSSPSVLPSPPALALTSSLSTPVTDYYPTYRPVLSRVLASLVTNPCASLSSVSALTATVTEFATTRRLDYATCLVAAPPTSPLAVEGESSLGCDALNDRQFELEFLAATSPHLCAMLLAPEGDPDALDILTPRTYAEAVSGPWASQWRAAMDSWPPTDPQAPTSTRFPPMGRT